jgi:transposase
MFEREEIATTTDIPQQPRPVVTRYRVAVCHCSRCGKTVRGTAPGLAADQFGATAHRVGPGLPMCIPVTQRYTAASETKPVPEKAQPVPTA